MADPHNVIDFLQGRGAYAPLPSGTPLPIGVSLGLVGSPLTLTVSGVPECTPVDEVKTAALLALYCSGCNPALDLRPLRYDEGERAWTFEIVTG